jgi:hypothetical protein
MATNLQLSDALEMQLLTIAEFSRIADEISNLHTFVAQLKSTGAFSDDDVLSAYVLDAQKSVVDALHTLSDDVLAKVNAQLAELES